jgi:uncharacterized protein YaeQ
MALKSTVYRINLHVCDMNLSHFAEYPLTLARHPSETAERLMMRVIAFALFADESLRFGAGLSSADEPDLVLADLTGAIKLWIEVGLPEVRWISKALSKAEKVVVVAYGGNARRWFRSLETEFVEARRSGRLALVVVTTDDGALFQGLATRNAQLSVTIQDDQLWLTGESGTVALSVAGLKDGVQ